MSNPFGKKNCMTAIVAGLFLFSFSHSANAQAVIQQIGGVWVNPDGVLSETTESMRLNVRQLVADQMDQLSDELNHATELRMISLKGLEQALSRATSPDDLPDEIKYMAGIQRIQYVFVNPDTNDLVIAGPGEGWTVDQQGNVVGKTTGRPVIRFEDFIVALRTAESANKDYGISVSINPTEEGVRSLNAFFKQNGFDPSMRNEIERVLGPQNISLTGLPTDSRMAQVLVAADYRMKRLAMGFEPAPIDGMPSFLELAQSSGSQNKQITPRFWMECSYEPLRKSANGLNWELRGPGVKTLTENQIFTGGGDVKKVKDHPAAKKWASTMSDKFSKLANADPLFAELQNVMDMAVIAALIQKHHLLDKASLDIPYITGANDKVALPKWSVPKTVSSQCSFIQTRRGWMVTASGGVQVDSWGVLEDLQVIEAIADIRQKAALDTSSKAWWNSIN